MLYYINKLVKCVLLPKYIEYGFNKRRILLGFLKIEINCILPKLQESHHILKSVEILYSLISTPITMCKTESDFISCKQVGQGHPFP